VLLTMACPPSLTGSDVLFASRAISLQRLNLRRERPDIDFAMASHIGTTVGCMITHAAIDVLAKLALGATAKSIRLPINSRRLMWATDQRMGD
jgi:hypothetical protein